MHTLPRVRGKTASPDSFLLGYDPFTHACEARPLTIVGWTSLGVSLSLSLWVETATCVQWRGGCCSVGVDSPEVVHGSCQDALTNASQCRHDQKPHLHPERNGLGSKKFDQTTGSQESATFSTRTPPSCSEQNPWMLQRRCLSIILFFEFRRVCHSVRLLIPFSRLTVHCFFIFIQCNRGPPCWQRKVYKFNRFFLHWVMTPALKSVGPGS